MSVTIISESLNTSDLSKIDSIRNQLVKSAGRGVLTLIRGHLEQLNQERHRNPQDSVGFYRRAAQGADLIIDGDEATVSVYQTGMLQRLRGGEIRAKNAKYLTIPAIPEALGRRAGEIENLRFVQFGIGGPKALIERSGLRAYLGKTGKQIKRKKLQQGEYVNRVFFWLKESVNQVPDSSVWPSDEEIGYAASDAINFLIRQKYSGVNV